MIGAGSVVVGDVPAYSIVGGSPARVIGYRFSEDTIKYLLDLKWREWDEKEIINHMEFFNKGCDIGGPDILKWSEDKK